jgi:hypothetical protein
VGAKGDGVSDTLDPVSVSFGGEVGWPVVEHHIGQDAQRPHITLFVVLLVLKNLGGHGERRSAETFEVP